MTQEEIVDIYKEVSNKLCNGTEWCWAGIGEPLQLFATLVAAKEREACAKMVDHIFKEGGGTYGDAIRARGEQA